MLDLKFIRANPDLVKEAARKKQVEVDIDRIIALDEQRRRLLVEVEALKAQRNEVSRQVGALKREGKDATELIEQMGTVGERIKALDEQARETDAELYDLMLQVPNLPDPDVPYGEDESGNVEVRAWGEPRQFAFEPQPHWDLGVNLDGLDFERAAKIAGSRFTVMKGGIAKLNRAVVNFFLNYHLEHGYTEVLPPVIVNTQSYIGTGQFPKFKDDVFALADTDYYLASTAEVPLVNMHRDEILAAEDLPIKYAGYSGCFRAEAGAAGRDTRGLIRQHYFEKVEMVQIVKPEGSNEVLEEMVGSAEALLQALGLPYRVVFMCTGDMGFTQSRKYDLEVWMPSYNRYVEISSCSNVGDFQARRANIRYRPHAQAKPEFVHILNGSGLAVGRTVAAILENYQNEDGSITVPEVLRPFMGTDRIEK